MALLKETRINFTSVLHLASKIASELAMPGQLMQPKRRKELIANGLSMLAGSIYRADVTTQRLETEIGSALKDYVTEHGIPFHYIKTKKHRFVMHYIPEEFRFQYYSPILHSKDTYYNSGIIREHLACYLPAATFANNVYGADSIPLPTEGYKDHRGVLRPFKKRSPDDTIQHGGIYITDRYSQFEIVSYNQLKLLKEINLSSGEALFEANWYMDSKNQDEVCARKNLQENLVLNCIGELLFADGKRMVITFSSSATSLDQAVAERDGIPYNFNTVSKPCTVRTIAAAYNRVAENHGALEWRVCGLEFNGGGVRTKPPGETDLYARDYFFFYPNSENQRE